MSGSKPVSLVELAEALRSGSLRLEEYLSQLEKDYKKLEPQVRAFVPEAGRFARLRREATALQARYPDPAKRPVLFGVPFAVKDIIHVKGMATGAGGVEPSEVLQDTGATSVRRLQEAGALVMGKTVTTEYVHFYFTPGPTRNPHNLEHTPGGSSSGSAAAVAAGYCPLALGTQTVGSLIRPAAYCGIVGYKPSFERIPTDAIVPLSPSLDHVGIFTTDVQGILFVAEIVCEKWTITSHDPSKPTLGIPEGPFLAYTTNEGLTHFRETCKRLEAAGYRIKSVEAMPDFRAIYDATQLLMAAEVAQIHGDRLKREGAPLSELIRKGLTIPQTKLAQARAKQLEFTEILGRLMVEHQLDLWISPSAPGPAPHGLDSTGDAVMNLPWTFSGLPTLNIPSGMSEDGLPMGLQVSAGWQADEALMLWGRELEQDLSGDNMVNNESTSIML